MLNGVFFVSLMCFMGRTFTLTNAFTDCEEIDVKDEWTQAYKGWPFRISCATLLYKLENWFDEDTDRYDMNLECIISNQTGPTVSVSADYDAFDYDPSIGTLLVIPDLHKNDPINYTVTIKSDHKCWFTNFHLKQLELESTTCNSFSAKKLPALPATNGSQLSCELDSDIFPKVLYDQPGMSYQWYYNCQPIEGAKSRVFSNLVNNGNYSCSVTYNRMTRFLSAINVTLEDGDSYSVPILKCESKTIKENVRGNVDVKCTLRGAAINGLDVVSLKKESGNLICGEKQLICQEGEVKSKSCGVSCYYINKLTNSTNGSNEEVEITINFENITQGEYGNYVLAADDTVEIVKETFELRPNLEKKLISYVEIVGVLIGILIFLLLLMGIAFYNIVYIRVFYKRYFGLYVTDDKEYGAMLAYNFSKDHDIFSQEILRTSVQKTRNFLQSRGYEICEEGKNGWFTQGRADCIKESVGKSHRIIIFVSREFIRDGWSMLALFQGFEKMINSGSKLIFILLPGIKEYLEQHSQNDDTCRLMQRAIKVNYSIKITRRNYGNRFNFQLEDAMPRLQHSSDSLAKHSLSSDSGVVFPMHCNRNYERCLSNESMITTLESGFRSDIIEVGMV